MVKVVPNSSSLNTAGTQIPTTGGIRKYEWFGGRLQEGHGNQRHHQGYRPCSGIFRRWHEDHQGLCTECGRHLERGVMSAPGLTFTITGNKISAVSGFDSITVSFSSDIAYKAFECRATKSGRTGAEGKGRLSRPSPRPRREDPEPLTCMTIFCFLEMAHIESPCSRRRKMGVGTIIMDSLRTVQPMSCLLLTDTNFCA